MARLMKNAAFREEQSENRYAEHIAQFNRYVDEQRDVGRGWLPYIAPIHGGDKARLLCVMSDPGKMTKEGTGSGFLCMENNDGTAARFRTRCAEVGLEARNIVPWNAYPWYWEHDYNRNSADRNAGIEPLIHVMGLMPKLHVVMLLGGEAHDVWKRLLRRYPDFVAKPDLKVIETYHTGDRVFACGPIKRAQREKEQREAFDKAAKYLRDAS